VSTAEDSAPQRGASLETVWSVVTPAAIFVLACLYSIAPNDFWWHLRTGGIILGEHRIPNVDLFTFSQAGKPWVNQAWLSEVALHVVNSIGGLELLLFCHALVIAFAYTFVLRAIVPKTGLRAASLATFTGALVGFANWHVRPQVASIAAFAVLVVIIEAHRNGRERAIWWTVPLFALWANLHGGFIFGVGALGLYFIGRALDLLPLSRRGEGPGVSGLSQPTTTSLRNQLLATLAAFAAISLNPEGPLGLIRYVAGFFESDATINKTVEFSPIIIRELDGILFFASLLLVMILIGSERYRPRWGEILPLGGFVLLTLYARRGAPWYGLLLIPLLGRLIASRWPRERVDHGSTAMNRVLIAVAALWVALVLPWWRADVPRLGEARPILDAETPVASTAFLCKTLPAGTRGYTYQTYASYQIAACPELPVFVDTRVELFPESQWDDYLAIWSARWDWETIVDRWGMTYLFLDIAQQPELIRAADESPRWKEIYRDHQAVIFDRVR